MATVKGNLKKWLFLQVYSNPIARAGMLYKSSDSIHIIMYQLTSPRVFQCLACISAADGNLDHPKFMISSSVSCHALSNQEK